MGRVGTLLRYPVKSLVGEEVDGADVDARGLRGDRAWSVVDPDGKLGSGKSSRRFRRMAGLLDLTATYDGEVPVIGFPDGRAVRADDPAVHDALSRHVGRSVRLAREEAVSHFDEGPLHLVTTSSVRALAAAHGNPVDVRRLRANLVLETDADGYVEDGWVGRQVAVGAAVLAVRGPMPRCVMLDLPQVDLAGERLLRTLWEAHDGELGVVADVVVPGPVARGDAVRIVEPRAASR